MMVKTKQNQKFPGISFLFSFIDIRWPALSTASLSSPGQTDGKTIYCCSLTKRKYLIMERAVFFVSDAFWELQRKVGGATLAQNKFPNPK